MTSTQHSSVKSQNTASPKVSATKETAATNEQIRKYLHEALEHLLAAGRSGHDLVAFAVDKFGNSIIPHLENLQTEIRQGTVTVRNLADAAKTAVFGIQVSGEQREQMIREAAYFRAEHNGFNGATADVDWTAAQQEVDALIEKQAGVAAKARKAISSAADLAEKEIAEVKTAITQWIGTKTTAHRKTN
jgi:hypothetical protein